MALGSKSVVNNSPCEKRFLFQDLRAWWDFVTTIYEDTNSGRDSFSATCVAACGAMHLAASVSTNCGSLVAKKRDGYVE